MAKQTTGRTAARKTAARPGSATARTQKRRERRQQRIFTLRRLLIALLALVLVGATIFFLVLRRGDQISISENAVGSLFSPVQNAVTTSARAIRNFFTGWRDYDRLQAAYDDLYDAKQRVDLQLNSAEQAMAENERLKILLEARDRYETLDPVYAKVIARDPGRWFDTFSVNRGMTNGITAGMAVCTGDGLVGRVIEVGLNYAKVLTIIDPRSAVACLVSRTRDNGVMRGQISDSAATPDCFVYYLPNVNNIVPGDTVITSGTDSLYPKGLAVGEVTAVSREAGSEGNYVVVSPYADFQHIEEVLILREVIETDDETLNSVPTPTPRPVVTPTPTPIVPGASENAPQGTVDPGYWQLPTPTPVPEEGAPGSPSTPYRYEDLPEDSWAVST